MTRELSPFAAWLESFLNTDGITGTQIRLQGHVARLPGRQRSLLGKHQWDIAFPLRIVKDKSDAVETIKSISTETSLLSLTPWTLDPEVRLMLTTAASKFLLENIPLLDDDLAVLDDHATLEIGQLAPRFALILYLLSSITARLPSLRRSERLSNQLIVSLKRRLPNASAADLIAIHVMVKRLLAMKDQAWATHALERCLTLSPLTQFLEDPRLIANYAPYEWFGAEAIICAQGMTGLKIRCSQSLIDYMLPGWEWHKDIERVRFARYRRVSELFKRLGRRLSAGPLEPSQALWLSLWLLNTYRLMVNVLDIYTRVVTPPPFDRAHPEMTPTFRMFQKFLPKTADSIKEYSAGLAAPIEALTAHIVEAARLTNTDLYFPAGLSETPPPPVNAPFPENETLLETARLIMDIWKPLESTLGATLGNMYQYLTNSKQRILP